ncbi:MAG: hypothetical protein ABGW84_10905 [Sphingomonadaceae bacterium]
MQKIFALTGTTLALFGTANLLAPRAGEWTIGPIIRGKNYSVNMPLKPVPTRNGWSFDFPSPNRAAGHVHYVTFDPGVIENKSRIVVRYRVTAAPETKFVPQEQHFLPGTVSLVIQRQGDNWSARGRYEHYRWYSPSAAVQQITPGVHQMAVSLNDPRWTSVYGKAAGAHPADFREALENASRVGLVFGSTSGRGHGVFATSHASFELLNFEID